MTGILNDENSHNVYAYQIITFYTLNILWLHLSIIPQNFCLISHAKKKTGKKRNHREGETPLNSYNIYLESCLIGVNLIIHENKSCLCKFPPKKCYMVALKLGSKSLELKPSCICITYIILNLVSIKFPVPLLAVTEGANHLKKDLYTCGIQYIIVYKYTRVQFKKQNLFLVKHSVLTVSPIWMFISRWLMQRRDSLLLNAVLSSRC